jgi:hypothetical protein
MKHYIVAFALAACAAAAGCVGFEHKTSLTTPTSTGVEALLGSWQSVTSASSIIPSPSTCTDFRWTPTQQTTTTATGSFSATCGGVQFAGTASGTLTGATTIAWSANGTATSGTLPVSPCAISLTGTAELGTNSIRVPYAGTTCLGAVSGVEILNKS